MSLKMSAPKTAFWQQIAEYLIFCTSVDKDVHNALIAARKMEITITKTKIQIQIQKTNKMKIQKADYPPT